MTRFRITLLLCAALTASASASPWMARAATTPHHPLGQTAGARILYAGSDGNVYMMDTDGGNRVQLTSGAANNTSYRYARSHDGKYILLLRLPSLGFVELKGAYLLDRDGHQLSSLQLVGASSLDDFFPSWAADADVIAYAGKAIGQYSASNNTVPTAVNVVGVDGSTTTRVWSYDAGVGCGGGGSTEDAASVQFRAEQDGYVTHSLQWSRGHYAIYTMSCTGGALVYKDLRTNKTTPLYKSNIIQVIPAPTTAMLAFVTGDVYSSYGVGNTIVVQGSNGSALLRANGELPVWSPDSRYLYFERCKAGPTCAIFGTNVARQDTTQLTTWQSGAAFGPLHITADGRTLIFSRIDAIDNQHARMSIQRLGGGRLTTIARDASRPAL